MLQRNRLKSPPLIGMRLLRFGPRRMFARQHGCRVLSSRRAGLSRYDALFVASPAPTKQPAMLLTNWASLRSAVAELPSARAASLF
jgi:hypothetical protein